MSPEVTTGTAHCARFGKDRYSREQGSRVLQEFRDAVGAAKF